MAISPFYRAYLKSKKWEQKRLQVFKHYGKRCYACLTYKGPIQVHHLSYDKVGHEPITDLMPLCKDCHKEVTRIYRSNGRRGLRRVTMEYVVAKRKRAQTL